MHSVLGLKLWSWLWVKGSTPWNWGKMDFILYTISLILLCCINIIVVWFQSCQNLARLVSNVYNDIVDWFQSCKKILMGQLVIRLHCPGHGLVWSRIKAITWSNNDPEQSHQGISSCNAAQHLRKCSGPRLNIKTNFPRRGDSHGKYEDYICGNR